VKISGIAFLIVVMITATISFAEVRYNFTELGTLGGTYNRAMGINNKGQIVGMSSDSAGGYAVLYNIDGTVMTLAPVGSRANAINDNGLVVGELYGEAYKFDLSGAGNNTQLVQHPTPPPPPLPGEISEYYYGGSTATSVNNNDQIVGLRRVGRSLSLGLDDPELISIDSSGSGQYTSLGHGTGNSINDSGQIVGQARFDWTTTTAAYYWNPVNGYQSVNLHELFSSPEFTLVSAGLPSQGSANWINSNGQAVGGVPFQCGTDTMYFLGPDGLVEEQIPLWGERAAIFDLSGGFENLLLGTLGGSVSSAMCINGKDQIVGWAADVANEYRATLFDPSGSGNNIDLNTLVELPQGWLLSSAVGINDNGWIIGNAMTPDGERAFLLTPVPEPVSLVMFGVGTLLLKCRQ